MGLEYSKISLYTIVFGLDFDSRAKALGTSWRWIFIEILSYTQTKTLHFLCTLDVVKKFVWWVVVVVVGV